MNRKLIRPNLTDLKEQMGPKPSTRPKRVPPEQTNAEAFYYLKQMNNKTPMVVVLQDGEKIRGVIEWYDKNCLKLNRTDRPNLLLLKHNIKYLYKESEEPSARPAYAKASAGSAEAGSERGLVRRSPEGEGGSEERGEQSEKTGDGAGE